MTTAGDTIFGSTPRVWIHGACSMWCRMSSSYRVRCRLAPQRYDDARTPPV